jgi:hypothetical protein
MSRSAPELLAARPGLLAEYKASASALDHLVQQGYPAGLMDFVPDIAGAWSIRSHIVHVLDGDLMCHHRFRFAIAQPGFTVPVWDEEAWQASLGYDKQNVTASVTLYRMLRSMTVSLLSNLSAEAWAASYSVHPVRGEMYLNDWLQLYTGHAADHLAYIKRNEAAWEKQGGSPAGCCG